MGSIPLYKARPSNVKQEEEEEAVPIPKRLKLSQPPENEVADGSNASTSAKQKRLGNTVRSTAWAIKTFQEWKEERNAKFPDDLVPDDILDRNNHDVAPLVHWLSRFLVEARNKGGSVYSPCSLHGLLCGILRYMREKNAHIPNFMDKNDPRFKELHALINSTFSNLREQGVRTYRKNSPSFITLEKENELWEQRVLGSDTPISLQRAVFFMICKVFYIKGGLEHRALKPSQFTRVKNPDCYTFLDMGSKATNSSLLRKVCADPSAGNRCMVYLLDLYFSKLPSYAFEKDILYLRPKSDFLPKESNSLWYEAYPVGKEKLRTMTHDMCVEGGILKSTDSSKVASVGSAEMPVELKNSSNASRVDGTMKRLAVDREPSTSSLLPIQHPLLIHYQPMPMTSGLVSSTGSSVGTNIPIVKVIVSDSGRRELVRLSSGQLELVQPITGHLTSLQPTASHQVSLEPGLVHQRSIPPKTDHLVSVQPRTVAAQPSTDPQVSIQPRPVHQVSIQPSGCPGALILPKTGHQISIQPTSIQSNEDQGISSQSSLTSHASNGHEASRSDHKTSSRGTSLVREASVQQSVGYQMSHSDFRVSVTHRAVQSSDPTSLHRQTLVHQASVQPSECCCSPTPVEPEGDLHTPILHGDRQQTLVQPSITPVQPSITPVQPSITPVQPSITPVQLSTTPVQLSTTPSTTPVQPSLPAQISKPSTGGRSLKMPQLKKRPSREHHKIISKIMSAIEMSDDPDVHCVYVCVHKSRRRAEGRKGRAAEAPF